MNNKCFKILSLCLLVAVALGSAVVAKQADTVEYKRGSAAISFDNSVLDSYFPAKKTELVKVQGLVDELMGHLFLTKRKRGLGLVTWAYERTSFTHESLKNLITILGMENNLKRIASANVHVRVDDLIFTFEDFYKVLQNFYSTITFGGKFVTNFSETGKPDGYIFKLDFMVMLRKVLNLKGFDSTSPGKSLEHDFQKIHIVSPESVRPAGSFGFYPPHAPGVHTAVNKVELIDKLHALRAKLVEAYENIKQLHLDLLTLKNGLGARKPKMSAVEAIERWKNYVQNPRKSQSKKHVKFGNVYLREYDIGAYNQLLREKKLYKHDDGSLRQIPENGRRSNQDVVVASADKVVESNDGYLLQDIKEILVDDYEKEKLERKK